MNQGTGPPDASLPRLRQTDTPTRTMTLSSLPTLRQALTMPGPGPLLATAAAGGSTAISAAIGQVALKMGRMMSTPGVNHPRSHGIGRGTTQYAVPDRPAGDQRYKDFFPCFWSVPLSPRHPRFNRRRRRLGRRCRSSLPQQLICQKHSFKFLSPK